MSLERPVSERKEALETRTYEYKNAEGEVIAEIKAAFGVPHVHYQRQFDDAGNVYFPKEVKALILRNPKDGREFDVLEALNPQAAKVLVPDRRMPNYEADMYGGHVLVPEPVSPVDFAVLLHELGHVEQLDDKKLQPILQLDQRKRRQGGDEAKQLAYAKEDFETLLRELPEVESMMDPVIVRAHREAATMEAFKDVALKTLDIHMLPQRMSERDATRRALLGLRRIRQETGIDLLSETSNPKVALGSMKEDCASATADGMDQDDEAYVSVSTIEAMRRDLATYGADKFRLGGGEDIGTMPSAGRGRKAA